MRYLADTHLALWLIQGSNRLSDITKELMTDPKNTWFLSSLSVWEVMHKHQRKPEDMLIDAETFSEQCLEAGFLPLLLDTRHIFEAAKIPLQPKHSDPFDRMLLAQARAEGLTLVTHDRRFGLYDTEPILLV